MYELGFAVVSHKGQRLLKEKLDQIKERFDDDHSDTVEINVYTIVVRTTCDNRRFIYEMAGRCFMLGRVSYEEDRDEALNDLY